MNGSSENNHSISGKNPLIELYETKTKPTIIQNVLKEQLQKEYEYIKLQEWESFQNYNTNIKESLDDYKNISAINKNKDFVTTITNRFKIELLEKLAILDSDLNEDFLSLIDENVIDFLLNNYNIYLNKSVDETADLIINAIKSNITEFDNEFKEALQNGNSIEDLQNLKNISDLKKLLNHNGNSADEHKSVAAAPKRGRRGKSNKNGKVKKDSSEKSTVNKDTPDSTDKPKKTRRRRGKSSKSLLKESVIKNAKKQDMSINDETKNGVVSDSEHTHTNDGVSTNGNNMVTNNSRSTLMSNGFIRSPQTQEEINRNLLVKAVKAYGKREIRIEALKKSGTTKIRTFTQCHITAFKQPTNEELEDGQLEIKFTFSQKHASKLKRVLEADKNGPKRRRGRAKATIEQNGDIVDGANGGGDDDTDANGARKKRKYVRKKTTTGDDNNSNIADMNNGDVIIDSNTESQENDNNNEKDTSVQDIGNAGFKNPIDITNNTYEPEQLLKYGMKLSAKEARSLQKYYDNTLFAIWRDISRKDAIRTGRSMRLTNAVRKANAKKISHLINKEARKWQQKSTKLTKDLQIRARRGLREMSSYWKKNIRDEKDLKKKKEKEILEMAKKEQELKEKNRQNKQLEFLLQQSEIVSSFIAKKGNDETLANDDTNSGDSAEPVISNINELDFDALNDEAIALKAKEVAKKNLQDNMNGAELNFTNPDLNNDDQNLQQPSLLACTLKEYQLNGLRWLNSLYSMNVNGILADEMGLGKTVQSISMLANLAENHNIWGPFLIVTPVSTLHNWVQEFQKFVPDFKILPYWGSANDRKTLRKFWDRKNLIYDKDKAEFHVMITSYQMIVNDIQYIKQLQWQYMILDEAQAIKSFQSQRWKNLLNINCKNKLLLTGTPIQNNLEELWALLHFIMPNFFQSIDNFNKIFNSDSNFKNSANLLRLHDILKPFMLRRVKKNVQKELEDKIEIDIMCELTLKQKKMYNMLKSGLNGDYEDIEKQALEQQQRQNAIENGEYVAPATTTTNNSNNNNNSSNNNNNTSQEGKLLNIVMEFRKVCNHPYLFESNEIKSSFSFSKYGNNVHNIRNNTTDIFNSTTNEIEYNMPRLIYEDLLQPNFAKNNISVKDFNVYNSDSNEIKTLNLFNNKSDYLSAFENVDSLKSTDLISRAINLKNKLSQQQINSRRAKIYTPKELNDIQFKNKNFTIPSKTGYIESLDDTVIDNFTATHYLDKWKPAFIEPCVAPMIDTYISGKNNRVNEPVVIKALKTIPIKQQVDLSLKKLETPLIQSEMNIKPINNSFNTPNVQVPTIDKFIQDSAKLKKLSELLPELKKGGHKCLIYFQMTKMMDMIEDYLVFKGYKYVRLDGSTTLERRRDLVSDFQTNDDIFIFLLSTRAGGLGINLVAADTVIFYDSDWNPTIDSQAMDRAHRLGQQRQVTVYRLICKDTIEEKMRDIANQKEEIQKLVMEGK
ncbi:hypothetical protein ACO0SA_001340 [Hanseniaspora valbyensis]